MIERSLAIQRLTRRYFEAIESDGLHLRNECPWEELMGGYNSVIEGQTMSDGRA